MRLPLRYFLLLTLLLGAVGVPWAWNTYQAHLESRKRVAEIDQLKSQLKKEYKNMPTQFGSRPLLNTRGQPLISTYFEWELRVDKLEDRLEQLTGERPQRPQPRAVVTW